MSQQIDQPSNTSTTRKRQRENNGIPQTSGRKSRKLSAEGSPASDIGSNEDISSKPASKHTKKERKQNRSTRIHSLRKQLARGTLPSTIQQEKERELAALLHEQSQTFSKKQVRKTLEKYHYVRFLERKKAEKKLKQLRKQWETQGNKADLSTRIHEMEVNRNYAIYAPLGEKYISLFVSEAGEESNGTDSQSVEQSSKPPTWYAIEAAMLRGEAELEALRDGKTTSSARMESDDEDANHERADLKHKKISPKPEKDDTHHKTSRSHSRANHKITSEVNEDAEQSSEEDQVDGGFFER